MGMEHRIFSRNGSRGKGKVMIRITQLKLPINHKDEDLIDGIGKALRLPKHKILDYKIIKKSIDARKKNNILYIYTVDVAIAVEEKENINEDTIIKRSKNVNVSIAKVSDYSFTPSGDVKLNGRPVVVGTGPAGLFCSWLLAKHGYQPLVIERGDEVRKRVQTVEHFWDTGRLNTESNVQFGEGGAGTFSDGKLNTMVKDVKGRNRFVLDIFAAHGAPGEILYLNKPHIGTDKLRTVVEHMREEIIGMGGEVRFNTKLTDIIIEDGQLKAIELNNNELLPCSVLVPAIGHSARDTFQLFLNRGLHLSPKPFAIGLRIEHKQIMIGKSQYGDEFINLPPADYKLTHQSSLGRGVYSFCMCPGGFVVNASSEEGHMCVNGMSNNARDEENANSAIVVTVGPKDFGNTDPLSGLAFQKKWEQLAYKSARGQVPVQLFGDLLMNRPSITIGHIKPNIKGNYQLTNLRECLPGDIIDNLIEGIQAFEHKIKGFAHEEAVLSAVETRTSSPVRIHRKDDFESNIKGIYPCGEGAGYAGGITSAAMDGIKVFESIASKYFPQY